MTIANTTRRATALVNSFAELNALENGGRRTVVSGNGVFVRDADGNELLDAVSGMWSAGLGFSNADLVEAAIEQMTRLPVYHASADKATEPVLRLCEELREIGPGQVSRVLLVNGGSEANDTQLKLLRSLWRWRGEPGRTKFIARSDAYHGSTLGSGSLSHGGPSDEAFGLPVIEVLRLSAPCAHWNGHEGETESEFVARLAEEFEETVVRAGPETIAGMFLEPVMGAGGVVVPPRGYHPAMQEVARRYGVRIVADEVICGFGRTGAMWGSDALGLVPDSTSCAKALTGGYLPAGAVLVDEDTNEAMMGQSAELGIFAHGFTTSGHPVVAAVASRALSLIRQLDLPGHVRRVAPLLHRQLAAAREIPMVTDVRGIGLLAGVELGGPESAARVTDVVAAATARGLIVRGIGSTICLCPPMVVTEDEIDLITSRLLAALREVHEKTL